MNELNTGSLETLEQGQTLLTRVRAVSGSKFEIEVAQIIKGEGTGKNLLSMLNADDSRFTSKARRAWTNATAKMMEKYFDVDVKNLKVGKTMNLNILNPSLDGDRLVVKITETTTARTYIDADGETITQKPKQIVKDGKTIYSNTTVDFESQCKHTKLVGEMVEDTTANNEEVLSAKKKVLGKA
jgi:hypothetical protein